MGEEKKDSKSRKQYSDSWFKQLMDWVNDTIRSFAAAIFFLFGIGAVFGAIFASNPYMLVLPFILGLVAYYSRDFAVVILLLVAFVVMFALV